MLLKDYSEQTYYDEMIDELGNIRPSYRTFVGHLRNLAHEDVINRQHAAERYFESFGITFSTYTQGNDIERTLPFDIIPRIIDEDEWRIIDAGLRQRIKALNMFLQDIYNEQLILKDGIIPDRIIYDSPGFLPQCMGMKPPRGLWAHISGIDLIKHTDGQYYILEDNLRVPSGVSYMMVNRYIMKKSFPGLFRALNPMPVSNYPLRLLEMLQHLSDKPKPVVAILTPGIYNSAYFEHSFLAQQMGIELVEGSDLVVEDQRVYMRNTKGLTPVDVIYRRIDDIYLDPLHFKPDSVLGVPGLLDAYRAGNVALANAPGTGIADDKVIYAYVPRMIRYYLAEEPLLSNVPTYLCCDTEHREYVLGNMDKMVVKAANESGGYGMLVGSQATEEDFRQFREKIEANPRNYIAQPIMSLSKVPTLVENILKGRHVDLRPYVLAGDPMFIIPGGLTRVALREGSFVVNSSQGGGSKDTWVLRTTDTASTTEME